MEDGDALVLTILCLSEGFNRGSARGPIRASLSVVCPAGRTTYTCFFFPPFCRLQFYPSRRRGQRIQVTACLPAPVTHTRRGWCVLGHQPVVTVTLCVPVRRLRRCVGLLVVAVAAVSSSCMAWSSCSLASVRVWDSVALRADEQPSRLHSVFLPAENYWCGRTR